MGIKALFIGQAYIDVTFLSQSMPVGDEKCVADDYAFSFGGNAVSAAFCCAKLGLEAHLICNVADDWPGRMFQDMARKHHVHLHPRRVHRSSVSFVHPFRGKRAILRGRDAAYLDTFPIIDLASFGAIHLDGHQADAAIHYAKESRAHGILTSLDGGRQRANTEDLLRLTDVAVMSELFCEETALKPRGVLTYLQMQGCKVGAVTMGHDGVLWYGDGREGRLPAYFVPSEKIVDTNGAGDIFHGAYLFSYIREPQKPWEEHFRFASAAAALSIQTLGIEASLPKLAEIFALSVNTCL